MRAAPQEPYGIVTDTPVSSQARRNLTLVRATGTPWRGRRDRVVDRWTWAVARGRGWRSGRQIAKVLKGLARGPKTFFKREPYLKPLQDKIDDLNLDKFFEAVQAVGELADGLPVRGSLRGVRIVLGPASCRANQGLGACAPWSSPPGGAQFQEDTDVHCGRKLEVVMNVRNLDLLLNVVRFTDDGRRRSGAREGRQRRWLTSGPPVQAARRAPPTVHV